VVAPSKLVVANDDDDACEVLARVLEADGHEVARISSAEALAGVVLGTAADGVVLDLMTAGYGANLDALERLRTRGFKRPGVRVVLVGAMESQEVFAWQSGIDGFLLRPFHAQALRQTMADALARSDRDRKKLRADARRRTAN
jgi:CheY-like chemotaxis protein